MSTEVKVKQKRNPDLTSIYIIRGTRDKLKELKKELGFRSYDALMNHMSIEIKSMGAVPPADYELVFTQLGTRPAIITGMSGSGKSTTVRELIARWPGNVFAVDVTGVDFPDLEKIDFAEFFSIKWKKEGQRLRFIPNSNVQISQTEMAAIFSHLNFIKTSEQLKNWLVLVDEAHRFSNDQNLRSLIIEGRKWLAKMLVVTTDWKVYEGIAKVFKPREWVQGKAARADSGPRVAAVPERDGNTVLGMNTASAPS